MKRCITKEIIVLWLNGLLGLVAFFYNLRKLIKVWQWQISSLLSGYSHQCIIFADMLYNFGNVKLGENPRKKSD